MTAIVTEGAHVLPAVPAVPAPSAPAQPSAPDIVPTTPIDGVPICAATTGSLTTTIISRTLLPGTEVFVGVNAHVVNLARHDPDLRDFLRDAATNYADGKSVVWAGSLLGGSVPERVATTDLAEPVLRAAADADLPVYFFGGAEGVAARAAEKMVEHVPGLRIRTSHGFVADDDVPALLDDIRAHDTRILFVGLGDPLQERWVQAHRDELPPVVLTCGGLFDWLSGAHRRAPRWMMQAGLEWAWRLLIEPRRLARRYLLGNPSFIGAVLRQRFSRRTASASLTGRSA
ncbi:WecB/TagA/CpsF family glycosyltransferase [Microbacterium sp. G2-8]|uniref:WecB/TagA/CpsF family glycosyltransferase n=1 Tax=Microbacterium sp. G2-8 TaxID=2842454 RepID=UPI001C89D52A|nr:WecB/TagA/CpsF family glycosyltransferase [Microbacterium sp. G2-8]